MLLCNPVRILGYENPDDPRDPKNGSVRAMEVIRMELGEPDERGRRRPVEAPGSEFIWETDCVIMALGTSPNPADQEHHGRSGGQPLGRHHCR